MPTISSDRHGDDETEQNDLNGTSSMTSHEEIQDDESVDTTSRIDEPQSSEHEQEEEEIEEADEFDDFDDFAEGEEHDDDAFGDFDTASGDAFDATVTTESIAETPSIKPSLNQPVSSSLPVTFDGVRSCLVFVLSLTSILAIRNCSASTACTREKMSTLHYRNT